MTANADIYALIDPRSGDIRYIGKAAGRGKRFSRLAWHLQDACYENHVTPKAIWIRELYAENLTPSVLLLEICDAVEVFIRERAWIDYAKAANWPITNSDGQWDDLRHERHATWLRSPEGAEASARGGRNGKPLDQSWRETPTGKTALQESGRRATGVRWQCDECSLVTTAPALGTHQKCSGHTGKKEVNS